LVRKVKRVPINLMAQIQRGDLRETNTYERGILGTKKIVLFEGKSLDEWDIRQFYSEEQVQGYIRNLVEGRRKFTEEIAGEGLRQEILYAAERSFQIDKSEKKAKVSVSEIPEREQEFVEKSVFNQESKTRPRRERIWRGR